MACSTMRRAAPVPALRARTAGAAASTSRASSNSIARGVVSCKVFGSLDDYLWKLSYKWATWRPNNKPKRWITGQYFGKLNTFRNDHWVFGDRDSGVCLVKFSWTAIRRHVPVKARHPAMTPPWPDTGPNGARRSKPE